MTSPKYIDPPLHSSLYYNTENQYYNDAATNWIDKEQEALIRRYEKEGSDPTSMFAGYRIY